MNLCQYICKPSRRNTGWVASVHAASSPKLSRNVAWRLPTITLVWHALGICDWGLSINHTYPKRGMVLGSNGINRRLAPHTSSPQEYIPWPSGYPLTLHHPSYKYFWVCVCLWGCMWRCGSSSSSLRVCVSVWLTDAKLCVWHHHHHPECLV